MINENMRKGIKKYREKNPTKSITLNFYQTNKEDMIVYDFLQNQDSKKTYLKNLILNDMKK